MVKAKKNRNCAGLQAIPSTLLRAHRYTTLWDGAVRSPKALAEGSRLLRIR